MPAAPRRLTPPPPASRSALQRATAPAAASPPGGARSSLVDVARLAGVSAGTVSRVLSRPEMISEATRARVIAAVERLGYVANGSARALAARRTGTVGALVPRFGSSSFPTMIQALESTLAAGGYTLLLSAPEHARARDIGLLRTLLERGVDALALLGYEHPPQTFSLLSAYRVPVVMMWGDESAGLPGDQSHAGACVGFDEAAAAALVVDHLADLGHRRIAFVGGRRDDNERARRRFQGLLAAVAARGLVLVPAATIEIEYGFRQGFEAMQALLTRGLPFSAVICGNDYLAAGALSALDAAGVAVPAQVSVASFNDNEFAGYLHPPLTTVHVPIADMGAEAGRYLLARLRGEPADACSRLPVRLVQRRSTGAAPITD